MAYCTCPGWLWWWRIWWNEDWQGKPKYLEKTFPSATLSNTNPTWPDPGSNPGRRGGKPATNRLSYGAANLLRWLILQLCKFGVWQAIVGRDRLSASSFLYTSLKTKQCKWGSGYWIPPSHTPKFRCWITKDYISPSYNNTLVHVNGNWI
jgi:hypothetical protein